MKKDLCILILLSMGLISSAQQDPQFSQYMFNLESFNPGSTGSSEMICLSGVNRQQWVGFPGAPSVSHFNVNAPVKPFGLSSGIGLSILSDNLGLPTGHGWCCSPVPGLDTIAKVVHLAAITPCQAGHDLCQ